MQDDRKDAALLKQCIAYFKSTPGFKRVFEKLHDKYRSLGTAGGTIFLDGLTADEKEALSGYLRKDYYSKKSASIKTEIFMNGLLGTRFEGVSMDAVLQGYFGGTLISKKQEQSLYEEKRAAFFGSFIDSFRGTRSAEWLGFMMDTHSNAYRVLCKKYEEEPTALKEILTYTCDALNNLPCEKGKVTRLALFAQETAKNPHCFDAGTDGGKLLNYGIAYFLDVPVPENMEARAELLYAAGIISDEVSNFVMCSGFRAMCGGKEHGGWKGFFEAGEPLLATLYNLSCIDSVVPGHSRVYIFENPTVFSEVLRQTVQEKPSLVCSYGQLKLAALIFLDKLAAAEQVKIYYAGDFDPEGLVIADKLKCRYKDRLILWRYSREDYETARADRVLEKGRLNKLIGLRSRELIEAGGCILEKGNPAYQEALTQRYIEDILAGCL